MLRPNSPTRAETGSERANSLCAKVLVDSGPSEYVGILSGNQALTKCAFGGIKSVKDYGAAKGLPRTAV
jgi:hypothetical protein